MRGLPPPVAEYLKVASQADGILSLHAFLEYW